MSVRSEWIHKHPPNHAGYYYCHICGGWVHIDEMELDHVQPRSTARGEVRDSDDNLRPSHAWPQTKADGLTVYCIGNRQKGSQIIESKTLEIAPGDEEW